MAKKAELAKVLDILAAATGHELTEKEIDAFAHFLLRYDRLTLAKVTDIYLEYNKFWPKVAELVSLARQMTPEPPGDPWNASACWLAWCEGIIDPFDFTDEDIAAINADCGVRV